MIVKQRICVPNKYKKKLKKWKKYIVFERKFNKEIAYKFIEGSSEHKDFLDYVKQEKIDYEILNNEYEFTTEDLVNAEILRFSILPRLNDSSNPNNLTMCSNCGKIMIIKDYSKDKLIVNEDKLKYDFSSLYYSDNEIIVSKNIKELFIKENVTGCTYNYIYNIDGELIEDYYYLKIEEGIGELIAPTLNVKKDKCIKCNRYKINLIKSVMYFNYKSWKGYDICYTQEWYGDPPSTQTKIIIISNKLYKILKKYKIDFYVEPAFLESK